MDSEHCKQDHLLVIRMSAMGDVAMTVPVLDALRKRYPDLRITMLTRPFFRPFFRNISGLELSEPKFDARHKGILGPWKMYRDLRKAGVTHVADLHDVLRSKQVRNVFRFYGARVARIDKGREEKKELTRADNKVLEPLKPTVERYRDVFLRLGFDVPQLVPYERVRYPVPAAISESVGPKLGRWIGVAPFAKHKGKIYPTSQSDELIGLLCDRYERVFVFGGGPYEKEYADYMEKRYKNAVSAIGKIDLDGELDLISNLDVMVSMDSSAMHMASLTGTPVVSIWGATHPYAGFYGFGQDPSYAVQSDMECRPCSVYGDKPCRFGDYWCMDAVSPRSVADMVEKVLCDKNHTGGLPNIK